MNKREAARKILDVLDDLDGLLQSGHKFLLGKWISDSKSWGYTEGVKQTKYTHTEFPELSLLLTIPGKVAIRMERPESNHSMGT